MGEIPPKRKSRAMLDFLEMLGFELDGVDRQFSVKLHSMLFSNHKPQSLCAFLVYKQQKVLVRIIGMKHCLRSYDRYY